jgi:hypothetical protein
MGLSLKPWSVLTRSFIALDHAVSIVHAQVFLNVSLLGGGGEGEVSVTCGVGGGMLRG